MKDLPVPVKVVWLTVKAGRAEMHRFPVDCNVSGLPVKVSGCP